MPITNEDVEFFLAEGRVDDLVHVVVDSESDSNRDLAAEKLIQMWKNNRQGGVTLDHLTYVGDHANEPYRSQANQIISDHL